MNQQTNNKIISDSRKFNDAIENDDFDTLSNLLQSGFDLRNPFTENCVRLAASTNGNVRIIKLLIEHGADINNQAHISSALCVAIEKFNTELVEFLVNQGANIHDTNSLGLCFLHTTLTVAEKKMKIWKENSLKLRYGHSFKHLFKRSSKTKVLSPIKCPETPLKIEYLCCQIMESLLKKDSSKINVICCLDSTVLCSAISLISSPFIVTVARILLQFGADANQATKKRETPLFLAVKHFHDKLISLLLEQGARLDTILTKNIKMNVLHYAIKMNRFSAFLEFLENSNFDVNSKTFNYHALPLMHYAVKKQRPEFLSALIEAGGDVTMEDAYCNSPLDTFRFINVELIRSSGDRCLELLLSHLYLLEMLDKFKFRRNDEIVFVYFTREVVNQRRRLEAIDFNKIVCTELPISFLLFLTASDAELGLYVKRITDTATVYKNAIHELSCCFQLFLSCFRRGQTRITLMASKNLLETISQFLSSSHKNLVLNIDCIERILYFTSNRDLSSLIKACCISI